MHRYLLPAAALAAAGPAPAQLVPLVDARLRHEHVDQDDVLREAQAVTLRLRAGVEARRGPLSALVEGQGNLALSHRYFDGLNGPSTRATVADPENVALYRAQARYAAPGITVTAGRQRIILDDERFVGAAQFRNAGQTFDAVRAELTPAKGLKADLTYAWGVRTIWGVDGRGARQQAVSGDNLFATLSYATPAGTLTGFAYLVDQDEAAVQAFRLSSQTYGARLAGARGRLAYQLSYARQSDYRRNPNDYRAHYYLADAALDLAPVKLGLGYEVLGADRGGALTSFQTPLSSVFKFQGWADKFTVTPPDGVRDLYASAAYALNTGTKLGTINLQAVYHRFRSDRNVRRYGDELNLLATAKLGRTALSLRYADYQAKTFAADTAKLWLQADWTF